MRAINCVRCHAASLRHLRGFAQIYEHWESLNWENVMDRLTQEKQPTPSQLELSFRKLAHCQFRPPRDAMLKDLNHLTHLCTSRKAISSWTPRKMVLMFSSCALLDYVHPQLLGDMCKDMREKHIFSELDHVELVMMIKSMGQLGRMAIKTNSVQPCGVFFGISELLTELMAEVTREGRGISFTEVQLCEMWKGLSRLQFYDVSFLDSLARETIKPHRLEYYNEASVVSLLLSAAILNYTRRHFIQTLLDQCLLAHRMKCYSEEDLTRLQCAMYLINNDRSLSSGVLSSSYLHAVNQEICKSHRLPEFSERQLGLIVAMWSATGTVMQKDIDVMVKEIGKMKRQRAFEQQKLNYMVKSIFQLRQSSVPSQIPKISMEPVQDFIKDF